MRRVAGPSYSSTVDLLLEISCLYMDILASATTIGQYVANSLWPRMRPIIANISSYFSNGFLVFDRVELTSNRASNTI